MKNVRVFLLLACWHVLPAAGEVTLPEDESSYLSPWNTAIQDKVDLGWKGSWKLASATLYAPHGAIQFPSAGHTLDVDYHGHFVLDYATAYFLASSHVSSEVFTGNHPLLPPAGSMPPGVPGSCAERAEFSGRISGRLFADGDLNLDLLRSDGSALGIYPWLQVQVDQAASQRPALTCDGAEVQVRSTGTIPPLGAGRPTLLPAGPVVEYDYEMDEDLTWLKIRSRAAPTVEYRFVRP